MRSELPVEASAPTGARGWIARQFAALAVDPVAAAVLLGVPTVLMASKKFGTVGFYRSTLGWKLPGIAGPIAPYLWWYGASVLLYLVVPLLVARRASPGEELGFGLGDVKFGLKASGALLALMLPVVAIAGTMPAFAGAYPLAKDATRSLGTFALYEAAYAAYFLAWEFLYRGFMLFPLARRYGPGLAILIQNVPFVLLHAGKPTPEAFGSIVAGVALGWLAWRSRSFLWGFFVHAICALTMDLVAGWERLFGA